MAAMHVPLQEANLVLGKGSTSSSQETALMFIDLIVYNVEVLLV